MRQRGEFTFLRVAMEDLGSNSFEVKRRDWSRRHGGRPQTAADTEESKKEILALYPDQEPFSTPKPERLLKQIITIATKEGDLILDSFAGSGTTGAVAQKMGRRWIMVELGEHGNTHIIPRLKKVIDGTDPGGVTEAAGWKGGGGFRCFRIAPSLLERDRFGNLIISKQYNARNAGRSDVQGHGLHLCPQR